jgi:hypothetical protein
MTDYICLWTKQRNIWVGGTPADADGFAYYNCNLRKVTVGRITNDAARTHADFDREGWTLVFDRAASFEQGAALLQQEWSVDVVEDAYGTTYWQRKGLNKR